MENGQTTLDRSKPQQNGTHTTTEISNDEHMDEPMAGEEGNDRRETIAQPGQPPRVNGTLVFEYYEPNVGSRRDASGDVEME